MLYTAAILVCMANQPHTFQSCEVINSMFKYPTEEICWTAINGWLGQVYPAVKENGHEIIDAKCISWEKLSLPKKDSL